MYAFQEVKENYTPQMLEWYKRFQKADRIKRLAYSVWLRVDGGVDNEHAKSIDRRMNFVWDKVKEVEPFPTFINGELTNKACYYLNGIQIFLLTKQIQP